MGKKKKIQKGNRGFATTSVVSKTTELGLQSEREVSLTIKKEEFKSDLVETESQDNTKQNQDELKPQIPKEFAKIFATTKPLASKDPPKNSSYLAVDSDVEAQVIQCLEREHVLKSENVEDIAKLFDRENEPITGNINLTSVWGNLINKKDGQTKLKQTLLRNYIKLQQIGFPVENIKASLLLNASNFDNALNWLSLKTVDENLLPPEWRRPMNTASGENIVTLMPISTTSENDHDAPVIAETKRVQKPSKPPSTAEKEKPDDHFEKPEDHIRNYILQYAEQSAMEENDNEDQSTPAAEQSTPLERYERLTEEFQELLLEAKSCEETTDKRSVERRIAGCRLMIDDLVARFPEVAEKKLTDEQAAVAVKNSSSKNFDVDVADDDNDDEGGFGGLFDATNEDNVESSSTSLPRPSLLVFDQASRGTQDPTALLEKHMKNSNKWDPTTMKITYHREKCAYGEQYHVKLPTGATYSMPDHYCRSKSEAQNYVAMKALFEVAPDYSYHLQMVPGFRHLWQDWKQNAKIRAENDALSERTAALGIIDEVISRATAMSSSTCGDTSSQNVDTQANVATSERRGWRDDALSEKRFERCSEMLRHRQDNSEKYAEFVEQRKTLPIMQIETELVKLLETQDVVVVAGQTGSGKTTQVPRMLFEHSVKTNTPCNIMCTEPRRISAISVASRVSEELADPQPFCRTKDALVGFHIRGERMVHDNTRITYCTTGVLLRMMQNDAYLENYSHVVVDEVHERSVESDILLVYLRKLLKRKGSKLKIVVMSATMDLEKLSKYFDGAPVVEAGGRTFPVSIFPLEDCMQLCNYICPSGSEYALPTEAYRTETKRINVDLSRSSKHGSQTAVFDYGMSDAAYDKVEHLDVNHYSKTTIESMMRIDESKVNFELIERLLDFIVGGQHQIESQEAPAGPWARWIDAVNLLKESPQCGSGAILIFLPGLSHIQKLYGALMHHRVFSNANRFRILRLHSTIAVSNMEQQQLFSNPPTGMTKIVLATNIAETGVTIPDVVYVIDCGRVKESGFQVSTQMRCLQETYVSLASLKQRAGRAGRVLPGIAFQLLSSYRIQNKCAAYSPPEILRVPLDGVCLQILTMRNIDDLYDTEARYDVAEFLGQVLDTPSPKAIDAALQQLAVIGAIKFDKNDEVEKLSMTHLGEHLARFPIDLRVGKMLIYGAIFRCLDPVLTIAASVDCENLFLKPSGREAEAASAQQALRHPFSDLLTIANVYRRWVCLGETKPREKFLKKYFLSARALKEMHKSKADLLKILTDMGFAHKDTEMDLFDAGSVEYLVRDRINENASNSVLVASILFSGLNPNVLVAARKRNKKNTDYELVFECKDYQAKVLQESTNYSVIQSQLKENTSIFLTFLSQLKVGKVIIRDTTQVPLPAIVLFGRNPELYFKNSYMIIDGWIHIKCNPRVMCLYRMLKDSLDAHLQELFENPTLANDELLQVVLQLLQNAHLLLRENK